MGFALPSSLQQSIKLYLYSLNRIVSSRNATCNTTWKLHISMTVEWERHNELKLIFSSLYSKTLSMNILPGLFSQLVIFRPEGRVLAVMNQSRCICVSVGIAAVCFANNFKLYLKNFEIYGVKIQWNCDFILTVKEYSVHEQINWRVNCGNPTEGLSHYVLT